MVAFLIGMATCAAQEVVGDSATFTTEKAGKLEKAIKKMETGNITKIRIIGDVNQEDLLSLQAFSSLTSLYLDKAVFVADKKESSSYANVTLPLLPQINTLYLFGVSRQYKGGELKVNVSLADLFVHNETTDRYRQNMGEQRIKLFAFGGNTYCHGGYSSASNLVIDHIIFYSPLTKLRWDDDIKAKLVTVPDESFVKYAKHVNYSYELDCKGFKISIDERFRIDDNINKYYKAIDTYKDGKRKIWLNKWDDSFSKDMIADVVEFATGAFQGANLSSIDIPSQITILPNECFKDCKNLKSVNLNGVKKIGEYVFCNTPMENIVLPSSIEQLSYGSFIGSNIKTVEMQGIYPPELIGQLKYKDDINILFLLPEGTKKNYNLGDWKRYFLREKNAKISYTFNCEKAGTLDTYITDAVASDIENLTITGQLYDTDFAVLKKCSNLRSLDISHCFAMKSLETAKKERAEKQYEMELLSMITTAASINEQQKFNAGRGNVMDATSSMAVADIFQKALNNMKSSKIEASDICYLPYDMVKENKHLESIKLPLQLKKVEIKFPKMVKTVEYPPYMESVSGLGDTRITDFVAPASLKRTSGAVFCGCVKLRNIDLSLSQIEDLSGAFKFFYYGYEKYSLDVFKAPKNLKRLDSFETLNGIKSAYFYTREAPRGLECYDVQELHIPKGSKAGWVNVTKYMKGKVIDDIDL